MKKIGIGFDSPSDSGLFDMGSIIGTQGALTAILREGITIYELIRRHHTGDWGNISPEDIELNEKSIREGGRIFSSYKLPRTGIYIWIMTEEDRLETMLLLNNEY